MKVNITFDQEFDALWDYLRDKYPKELFDMDGVGKQLDLSQFSKNFFSTKTTTADASIDANANVDDMSVIAYSIELKKPYEKLNSYYMLWKELKRYYGTDVANKIIEMQLSGDIYIHDFHGIGGGLSYYFNYSTYDIMQKGLPMVKKIASLPPKYLYAFKSQAEQFVTIASNSTLGATGLADLLIIMALYVDQILKNHTDAHFKLASEEDCWRYAEENLASMIYTINQPMRANQSPFTNVSVYDKHFLEDLCQDYIHPQTGESP
jgi:ribonucleoside-triphosphate reductase